MSKVNVYCGKFWCIHDDSNVHQYVKAASFEEATELFEAMATPYHRLTLVEEIEPTYTFNVVGTVNGKEHSLPVGVSSTSEKRAIRSAISMFKSFHGGLRRGRRRTNVEITSYTFTKEEAIDKIPEHYYEQKAMY